MQDETKTITFTVTGATAEEFEELRRKLFVTLHDKVAEYDPAADRITIG